MRHSSRSIETLQRRGKSDRGGGYQRNFKPSCIWRGPVGLAGDAAKAGTGVYVEIRVAKADMIEGIVGLHAKLHLDAFAQQDFLEQREVKVIEDVVADAAQ